MTRKKAANKTKPKVQEVVNEEESEHSFRELDTDPDLTDYHLEQSIQNQQPSTSKAADSMVRRTPKKKARVVNEPRNSNSSTSRAVIYSDTSEEEEELSRSTRSTQNQTASKPAPQPKKPSGATSKTAPPPKKPEGAAKRKATPKSRAKRNLEEIRRLQQQTTNLVPRAPFARLVRYIMQKNAGPHELLRITPQALEALQESSELYLTGVLSDSFLITLSRKQVTLQPRDINLLMFLRGPAANI